MEFLPLIFAHSLALKSMMGYIIKMIIFIEYLNLKIIFFIFY